MSDVTINRPLAGGAKNLLDDLRELDRKTTEEMARGVRESYLDSEGVDALAAKLGVDAPRIRRTYTVFYERSFVYSIGIEAYDREEALREADARLSQAGRAGADNPYGYRNSHYADSERRQRVRVSEAMWDRPVLNHEPTRFYDQRGNLMPLPGAEETTTEALVDLSAQAANVGAARVRQTRGFAMPDLPVDLHLAANVASNPVQYRQADRQGVRDDPF